VASKFRNEAESFGDAKLYFNRIMELYSCSFQGAAIQHDLESLDALPDGIVKIGQACLRTADLVYAKRFRSQSSFNQNVEDILADTTLEYEPGAEIALNEGKVVKVDFKVKGIRVETAVQTLSSGNTQYAHQRAVEINARWDDIRELSSWADQGRCLTILDDTSDHYDDQDLDRLRRKSILLPFSAAEAISDVLKAA